MRYIGLDVGARYIGVAVGEVLAEELTTIRTGKNEKSYQGEGRDKVVKQIEQLIDIEEADAVVIGLPVNEEGSPTEESKKISEFAKYLEQGINKEVHFTNETLTSFMAEEILKEAGLSDSEVSNRVHQASAQLILQQFLEEGIQ